MELPDAFRRGSDVYVNLFAFCQKKELINGSNRQILRQTYNICVYYVVPQNFEFYSFTTTTKAE